MDGLTEERLFSACEGGESAVCLGRCDLAAGFPDDGEEDTKGRIGGGGEVLAGKIDFAKYEVVKSGRSGFSFFRE